MNSPIHGPGERLARRPLLLRHPLGALAWELWARHRLANNLMLLAVPVCALGYSLLVRWGGVPLRGDLLPLALLPMLVSLLWLFSLFSCTETDRRRGFTGIPARFFTLPVRSFQIVATFTGLGALSVALLYVVWVEWVFLPAGVVLPARFPAAALATGLVFFQAVVWGLASFPWLRVGALVAGAFGFFALNVVGLSDSPAARSETGRALVVLAFLPLAYLGALFGVHAERRGGWLGAWWLAAGLRALHRLWPRRAAPFPSQAAAQRWFDWRRRGWFFSAALCSSIASVVISLPVGALLETTPRLPLMTTTSLCLFPFLMAGILGLGLAKSEQWSKDVILHPFHGLRPVTDEFLVLAKFATAARMTALGWLLAPALTGALALSPHWRSVWRVSEISSRFWSSAAVDRSTAAWLAGPALLLAVALTWKVMIESLSIGLSGRPRTILTRGLARGGFVVGLLSLAGWLLRHPFQLSELAPWLHGAALALAGWKSVEAVRAFRATARQRLASGRTLVLLGALWWGFALALTTVFVLGRAHSGSLQPLLALLLAGLWPDGALARAFLHLHANRHR